MAALAKGGGKYALSTSKIYYCPYKEKTLSAVDCYRKNDSFNEELQNLETQNAVVSKPKFTKLLWDDLIRVFWPVNNSSMRSFIQKKFKQTTPSLRSPFPANNLSSRF